MPAPIADLTKFGSAPNQYSTEAAAEGMVQYVADQLYARETGIARFGGVVELLSIAGSSNITASLPSEWADVTIAPGFRVFLVPIGNSSLTPTLNVAGTGAKPVTMPGGEPLTSFLRVNRYYTLRLTGSGGARWEVIAGGEADDLRTAIIREQAARDKAVADLDAKLGARIVDESLHRRADDVAVRTEAVGLYLKEAGERRADVDAERHERIAAVSAARAAAAAGDAALSARMDHLEAASVAGIAGPVASVSAGLPLVPDGGYFLVRNGAQIDLYQRINSTTANFAFVWAGQVAVTDATRVFAGTGIAALRATAPASALIVDCIGRDAPFDGWHGRFGWVAGDQSDEVAADPYAAIWVAPSSDLTGASGAWRRITGAYYEPQWWGLPGPSAAARIVSMQTMAAAHLTPVLWGEMEIPLDATIRLEIPNAHNAATGRGPLFVLASQNMGVFSVGRLATNFHWIGNIRARLDGIRTAITGNFGGLSAFQRNCVFWFEAHGCRHEGFIDTQNLCGGVVLRGPVRLRDGTYPAYADYDGIGGGDVDERENMDSPVVGLIRARGQEFGLTGIQHGHLRAQGAILDEQTFVQGIDTHTVYMTGRGDAVYGAICRDAWIGMIGGADNIYSMPAKFRDCQDMQIGTIRAYRCAGAALFGERNARVNINSIVSLDQIERGASAPTAPATAAVDAANSIGVVVENLHLVGAEGAMVRGAVSRLAGELTVHNFIVHQLADAAKLLEVARSEDTGRLTINDAVIRRTLPFGHTATTEIGEMFVAVDDSRIWVNSLRSEGAAYYRRILAQRGTAQATLSYNSDLIEGYDGITPPVDVDDYALVLLSDSSGRDRVGPKAGLDVIKGHVQTLTGAATPITRRGDGVAAPIFVAQLTSCVGISIRVFARQAVGAANAAEWRITGMLVRGTTPDATVIHDLKITLVSSTPTAADWAAPTIIADTFAGGLILLSGAVPGTIDWTARGELLGTT